MLRVSDEEREIMKKRAEQLGFKDLSKFMRSMCLYGELTDQQFSPVWHFRFHNGIRQWHGAPRQLTESEVELVPDQYWQDDPIYNVRYER